MDEKTKLQRISEETMQFMRGKYVLDEVGNGKDELKCTLLLNRGNACWIRN